MLSGVEALLFPATVLAREVVTNREVGLRRNIVAKYEVKLELETGYSLEDAVAEIQRKIM